MYDGGSNAPARSWPGSSSRQGCEERQREEKGYLMVGDMYQQGIGKARAQED